MSQPKPANPDPTQIAGRFDIVSRLGAGAFGTVFKAKDAILGRMVAIKTIRLEGLAAQGASIDEMLERFGREARVAAQLKHPNIVTVYDFGTDQGLSYLAMEFIDGVGLDRLIANEGRIPAERAAMIMAQVADALDFAHKGSVVHRDIKPANIMIESGDRVKVADFGIAKAMDSGEHLTMTGSLLGTPSYMSPEQARGSNLDGRSDLFAAGAVLYEMVCGKKAFRGESITGLIFKIITEEPPSMLDIDPLIPEPMIKIVAKALAKTPETRYQTGKEMAEDLLALTRSGSWPTMRQSETPTANGVVHTPASPDGNAPTVLGAAPTTMSPAGAVSGPTVMSPSPAGKAPAPPPPPAAGARPAPATRASAPPPPPPRPSAGPARKSGGGMGLVIGALAALLIFGVIVVGGGLWWFNRTPAKVADNVQTPTPVPQETVASTGNDGFGSAGTATPDAVVTEVPPADTEAPTTNPGKTPRGGTGAATFPPSTSRTSAPVRSADGGDVGTTAGPETGGNEYAYLDREDDTPALDGEAAGGRVSGAYSSSQGGQANAGGYGVGGRLRGRPKSPRNLSPAERPGVATIRYLINAEERYKKSNNRYASLAELLANRTVLDVKPQGNAFTRRGYRFEVTASKDDFKITAEPQTPGPRQFVGDDSGFILEE